MKEFAGMAVLEVDGVEIEITKLDVKHTTGRKPVKVMNSTARVKGYSQGIKEWTLSITAVKPLDGQAIDWANIKDSKVTCYPIGHDEQRISYLHCFVTEVGESSTIDNEVSIDLQLVALDEVKE